MRTGDTPLPSMRFGQPFFWCCRAAIIALALVFSTTGDAQAIRIVNGVMQTDEPAAGGFVLKKVDPKITDALADFNRYAEKQAWEKAFKAVEPLADVEVNGMIPSKDGFYFPARQAVMNSFLSMSAEGREAYRLFNDARAKQQFEQATNHPDTSDDNIPALRKLVSMYFITSIGQQAADRLGDDLFESGDFGGAEQAWAAIVDQQADSDLNIPRIQLKRGVAMARTHQTSRAKEIIGWLKEHAADTKTTVGGKEVSPAEYLASLIETPATTQASAVVEADLPPLVLPQSDTPKWHFKFGDQQIADQIASTIRGYGWQNFMPDLLSIVPGSAADEKHAYVNWLGVCYGLDARTGKLLWRTDKPSDIGQQIQQFVQYSPEVKRFTVACAGDRALFVRISPKQMNFQESYRLYCYNAQTGAQQWSSESGTLSGYSFACVPLVVDGTVYATAASNNGQEIFLIAINLANGRSLWSLSLGQATGGTNWRGMQTVPVSNLLYNGGKVYVLTNNGALLAVNVGEKRLMWALRYDGTPMSPSSNVSNGQDPQPQIVTPASMFVRDNVLYCKERNADQVYAVDLNGPSLKWKRPCEPDETIVGMDDSRIYTAGVDVGGIDCASKKLLWSRRLPVTNGSFRPMMSGNSIFFFLGRGIYQLDSREGEIKRIFRGYDRDSGGGAVYQTAVGLITVSDQALTAYAMPSSGQAQK
ncbi:MAG TPA: PQQ-binding-like beta-propeller repeat protein [Tepidisphaeraceae bacterium]|nr:PQQ-binding-like beta-propeller repeat protein [Tepidisphaeraceae bacterium]